MDVIQYRFALAAEANTHLQAGFPLARQLINAPFPEMSII
jgi:hypothetical protein